MNSFGVDYAANLKLKKGENIMFSKFKGKSKNKGFTLVELIIVVAIIAVLAAVLAPQYLQYVERSRESNDLQIATSIMRAATTTVADPMVGAPSNATYTITWGTTASTAPTFTVTGGSATDAAAVEASIENIMGWTGGSINEAQSAAGNNANFVFTVNVATGQITIAEDSAVWETTIGVNP